MAYSWWDNYTAPFNETAAGGGPKNLYFTSTHEWNVFGPNYVTYAVAGNINDHAMSEPGTTNVLATAITNIPITWSGITLPAAATITRVTLSQRNNTGTGTLEATALKMDSSGTKTNLNSGGTTTCNTATTWTATELTMDTGTTVALGDTIGILIGEFTQNNGGAGATYTFRVTYEFQLT